MPLNREEGSCDVGSPSSTSRTRDPEKHWCSQWLLIMASSVVIIIMALQIGRMMDAFEDEEVTPVVHTLKGTLQGVREVSEKGQNFFSFYAIPFAKPPVGELRLQDPVEAEAWSGIRISSTHPSPCIQINFRTSLLRSVTEDDVIGSEDCLYLNVFTPKLGVGHGLPVMVYLHGGGYVSGAANKFLPYVLLNHQIVMVVPQFRLGTLGFLSTEDDVMSGNYMLKDQLVALRWVRDNILTFGGDPRRVTVFGQSSGAMSSALLALSPRAHGLFSRVILQSGTAIAPISVGKRHAKVAEETAHSFGLTVEANSRQILSHLQTVPAASLAVVYSKYMEWYILPFLMLPRVDGDIIPASPYEMLQQGASSHVDLMTGITTHDGALLTHILYMQESMKTDLKKNFPHLGPISLTLPDSGQLSQKVAATVYRYYLGDDINLEDAENTTQLFTDYYYGIPSDLTALSHARSSNSSRNTFAFELVHRGERSFGDLLNISIGKDWVTHADDLVYLFTGGHVELLPLSRPQDIALREIMTTLWVNFAATGNPTPDDSLGFTWEAVKGDNVPYLALAPSPAMRPDLRLQVREFFRSLFPQHNIIFRNGTDTVKE